MGPMIQQFRQACEVCQGQGKIGNDKFLCKDCKGKKVLPEEKTLEIIIEKGMKKWTSNKI